MCTLHLKFLFLGEIPWEMLRTLVQEHSLRQLGLGNNKFTVDTIPEVVGTMTKLKVLDLSGLGYTGKSGTPPVMSQVTSRLFFRSDS